VGLAALLIAGAAAADWLQPDPTYRDAQFALRAAVRDTAGQPRSAARLDTLAVALLRLGRFAEAESLFQRVLSSSPGDDAAESGLGKLALFRNQLGLADSLLTLAAKNDPLAVTDLFSTKVRRGEYGAAADLAEAAGQGGREALLRALAARHDVCTVGAGPESVTLLWVRSYPVPLVRVKLNGQSVLMAIDTGAPGLLLDESAARRARVEVLPSQASTFWCGSRVATRNALVQRLDLGGIRVENVPAGTLPMRRWSLELNPQSEPVVGAIGLDVLRLFVPTLDFKDRRLVLRRLGRAVTPVAGERRVPFEMWGESELMVNGRLGGGRRMALVVQSGIPGCGVAAPEEVFEEIGVKAGMVARMVKGAGAWLQGRRWSAVVVPTVELGPIVRDKVPGWSGAFDSSEMWRHGVRRDGALSNDFFRDQRVTIDWETRELVFE
jgi:hypothetical protein